MKQLSETANTTTRMDDSVVKEWRVSQLKRLGVPAMLSEMYADRVDWHHVARLMASGCPPQLAVRIAS